MSKRTFFFKDYTSQKRKMSSLSFTLTHSLSLSLCLLSTPTHTDTHTDVGTKKKKAPLHACGPNASSLQSASLEIRPLSVQI